MQQFLKQSRKSVKGENTVGKYDQGSQKTVQSMNGRGEGRVSPSITSFPVETCFFILFSPFPMEPVTFQNLVESQFVHGLSSSCFELLLFESLSTDLSNSGKCCLTRNDKAIDRTVLGCDNSQGKESWVCRHLKKTGSVGTLLYYLPVIHVVKTF